MQVTVRKMTHGMITLITITPREAGHVFKSLSIQHLIEIGLLDTVKKEINKTPKCFPFDPISEYYFAEHNNILDDLSPDYYFVFHKNNRRES